MTQNKIKKRMFILPAILLLLAAAFLIFYFSTAAPEPAPTVSPTASAAPTPVPSTPPVGAVTGLNAVTGDELLFLWDAVPDADCYMISITDPDGNTVLEKKTAQSIIRLAMPDDIRGLAVTVTAVIGDTAGKPSEPLLLAELPEPEITPEPTAEPIDEPDAEYTVKVNKAANCVTIYRLDGEELSALRAFVCSCGESTPEGSYRLDNKWRWLCMVDDSYGQWVSQISGNYLFHSVPYWGTRDAEQLDVAEYNKLGSTASHGCVRLTAGDAKWIYDNVPQGTLIVIYSDPDDPGPLGKPSVEHLPDWHTWDPSDPGMSEKCKSCGCH